MQSNKKLANGFLLAILAILLATAIWIFRPFLLEIVLAGVIASFFYPLYKWLLRRLNHKNLAALVATLLIALIVIIPLVNLFIYVIARAIEGYAKLAPLLSSGNFLADLNINKYIDLSVFSFGQFNLNDYIASLINGLNSFLIGLSKNILVGAKDFVVSFMVILLTIYFLFTEGKNLLRNVMNLTPLPNRYDQQLFTTFRDVSFSTMVSTFAVSLFQGLVGGIGFWLAGLPGLLGGILIALASFIPFLGAFLIWGPTALYLLLTGRLASAVIILVFGVIVSTGDNVIRAYLIKGKTKVHELVVFFSIFGGIVAFGFWGFIIGPLLISLLFTVIKIYEIEFGESLEKEREAD